MKKLVYPLALAALALALLPATAARAEATPGAAIERLLKREAVRVAAMDRMSRNETLPAPPPLPAPLGDARAVCATASARRVDVSTAAELQAALAAAQPGDLIALADGVYTAARRPGFVAAVSGTAAQPIALCGTRAAVLEAGALDSGYGFALRADHWVLAGFSVRNAAKGVVLDGASSNVLSGLEVSQIGEEGVHFRAFSSHNRIERSWVHDVGLREPQFGEGVYIGSAHSNWGEYSGGLPDASDANKVIGNLIGPNVTAESVDVKEGTSAGVIRGNTFLGSGMTAADSWVDLKGNGYTVAGNDGAYDPGQTVVGVEVNEEVAGWGRANSVTPGAEVQEPQHGGARQPFRLALAAQQQPSVVLPARALPYTLAELAARFPASVERAGPGVLLVKEPIVAVRGARLALSSDDAREVRLLSTPATFASIVGFRGELTFSGSPQERLVIRSWDPARGGPDTRLDDGRAYVLVRGGRMDIEQAELAYLGFSTGFASGAAWKGIDAEPSRGAVTSARFERNFTGAEADGAAEMVWRHNAFADNARYGFAARNASHGFVFEENLVARNGAHGVIFSYGSSRNRIRDNRALDNGGGGIVLAAGEEVTGGLVASPDDNLVERNLVAGNQIGIRVSGGSRNVVRNNSVRRNGSGITLAERAAATVVSGNSIVGSARAAITLKGQARDSRVESNTVTGGVVGVLLDGARANTIRWNTISAISGRGLVLRGDIASSYLGENTLSGRGLAAIDFREARGVTGGTLEGNSAERWVQTGSRNLFEAAAIFLAKHLALIVWMISLLLPFVSRVWRWKKPDLLLMNGPRAHLPPVH